MEKCSSDEPATSSGMSEAELAFLSLQQPTESIPTDCSIQSFSAFNTYAGNDEQLGVFRMISQKSTSKFCSDALNTIVCLFFLVKKEICCFSHYTLEVKTP